MTPPDAASALERPLEDDPRAVAAGAASSLVLEQPFPAERGQYDPRRPAPAPDRPRHLHAVPGRPAPGRRPPFLLFFGMLATAAVLIGLVTINVLIGQSGVREASLQKAIDAKQQQVDMLQVDVLRLSAPARIYQRAQRLGMVPAGDLTYLAPASPNPSAAPSPRRGGD